MADDGVSEVTASATVARMIAAIRAAPAASVTMMAVVTAVGSIFDLKGWIDNGGLVLLNGLNWAAGYLVLVAMMRGCGLFKPHQLRGAGSYFVMSFVSGLAVFAGLLLLIVPGIILIVRWLPAYAILLAEGKPVFDSLSESWKRTRGHFLALALAGLLWVLAAAGMALAYMLADFYLPEFRDALYVLANGFVALCVLIAAALTVAAYIPLANAVTDEADAA